MAFHLGCDLYDLMEISQDINYDISDSEAGCVLSLRSRGLEKCSASWSPESSLNVKSAEVVCRQAVFHDFWDGFSKLPASQSSLVAMDDLKTL